MEMSTAAAATPRTRNSNLPTITLDGPAQAIILNILWHLREFRKEKSVKKVNIHGIMEASKPMLPVLQKYGVTSEKDLRDLIIATVSKAADFCLLRRQSGCYRFSAEFSRKAKPEIQRLLPGEVLAVMDRRSEASFYAFSRTSVHPC